MNECKQRDSGGLGLCIKDRPKEELQVMFHLVYQSIVQEKDDGEVEVSALDPLAAMNIAEGTEALKNVVSDAAARLKRVVESL